MARLYYMSLPGVGPWDRALKDASAQLSPYVAYLNAARNAAQNHNPVIGWRLATLAEAKTFGERMHKRYDARKERAAQAKKRRDREWRPPPDGTWIVLEPPPWRPEEPEDTFEAFLGAGDAFDSKRCPVERRIDIREFDREGRALLVSRPPDLVQPPAPEDDLPPPERPSESQPFGALIWLRPDIYQLGRQLDALYRLQDAPTPRRAPLTRLLTSQAAWPDVDVTRLADPDWVFLRPDKEGALRDGTPEQREFVEIALATPDFAILEGPPGSGKTTAICELIVQCARRGQRVMLVASTHVAVDNVLERLLKWQDRSEEKLVLPVRIGSEQRVTSERVEPWIYSRLLRTWRADLLEFLDAPKGTDPAGGKARDVLRAALRDNDQKRVAGSLERLLLESANLVCGTTIGILQHPAIKAIRQGEPFEPFDVLILDEASKTTFAEFLVPALHANKWVIVGDVRQLSPYVEEQHLAVNLTHLVPATTAQAAVHAFLCSDAVRRRVPALVAVATEEEAAAMAAEAAQRDVPYVDLDAPSYMSLHGFEDAIPELLHAQLVFGTPGAIQAFEHRIPGDLEALSGPMPALGDWEAHRSAVGTNDADPITWAGEAAWRLVRAYELRHNPEERARYEEEIDKLLPTTLDDSWFDEHRVRRRTIEDDDGERDELPAEGLRRKMETIRRVTMPSVLELLQRGFERLDGWEQDVALTGGLPRPHLQPRFVSLTYQHRMHPDLSTFPREQFYAPPAGAEDAPQLLQDAATMESDRAWSYSRYKSRAMWIDVAPQADRGRRRRRGNANEAEAEKVMQELRAFVDWARGNQQVDEEGREIPWEVAVLSFYRGQEALLRKALQEESKLFANTRNFHLPPQGPGKGAVHVTLCTVDQFQGHEADVVMLSFVKSGSIGFLNSPNRLNVALTRARYQLLLIGHRTWFAKQDKSPILRTLASSPHYDGDIGW